MKLKALVAVMALAAGAAHANIPTFADTTQGGSLNFTMWNAGTGTSSFFDLGLSSTNFTFANVGTSYVVQAGDVTTIDKQIVWNFTTGTVTGTANVASVIAGVSGDWAAAWNAYQPNVAGSVYDVYAGDIDGTLSTKKHLLTTASTAVVVKNSELSLALSGISTWNTNSGNAGNHLSVTNGANVVTDPSSLLYQGANTALKTNFAGGLATVNATGATNSALSFYGIDGVTGTSAALASVTNYNGSFELNEAAGTLTWTTLTPVPEASTYAMLLAGLGLMGLMARRRTK